MKPLFALIATIFLFSCAQKEALHPREGSWRAILKVTQTKQLPFTVSFKDDHTLIIYNADEVIEVSEINYNKDSITIKMPVFEGVFKGTFTDEKISGVFVTPNLDRKVPFKMEYAPVEKRFASTIESTTEVSGIWETVFSPQSETESYIAKGIFTQEGNRVTGTFETTTGDYRYLEGIVRADSLLLSTFDGAHAFLFEAKVTDSTLHGQFYSGNHWKEPFTARRNETYTLPNPESLTYLKEGYETFDFSFPDTEGNMISLQDERYKDKVVIVQLMGTWCPNCLDETKFLTQYLEENDNDALAVVALAFEYAPTKEKAFKGINRLKERIQVPYPILLAQYGSSDKTLAQEKLPMLNHVLSYPTTIFIDKKGKVRKIHTGFNGPATGTKYDAFVKDFGDLTMSLLQE